MKKLTFIIFIFGFCAFSQQSPTFAETEKYIKEKISDTYGHQVLWNTNLAEFIIEVNFSAISPDYDTSTSYYIGNNKYRHRSEYNAWREYFYNFSPKFIVSVTEASGNTLANSPVGFIAINFSADVVKENSKSFALSPSAPQRYNYYDADFLMTPINHKNVGVIYLPYFKQDPNAFERLKKAIMHLKSFYVEDDPFAN